MVVLYMVNFSEVNNYVRDRYYSIISKEIVNISEAESDNYNIK